MTVPAGTLNPFQGSAQRRYSRVTYVRYPVALAFGAVGGAAVLAAALDLTKGQDSFIELLLYGAVLVGWATVELRRLPAPVAVTASGVYTMVVWAWFVAIVMSVPIYLLSGVTGRVDNALFESTAGLTTTAATTLVPEDLPRGILAFRALSQWVGGAAALVVAVVLVPTFTGGRERMSIGSRRRAVLAPSLQRGLKNIAALYGGLTIVVLVAYVLAGMGPFDGLTYAMTTVSTGGFANHSESLGFFNSGAIEWIAVAAMFLCGVSAPALWWMIRGESVRLLTGSREFRLYLAVFLLSLAATATWLWDTGASNALRRGAFAITSAMSTTGLIARPLADFDNGALVVLLGLTGIGTMAVAIGGGFDWLRVLEAWGFARRELQYQLHPRSVRVVKLGRERALSEESLSRMNAYVLMFVGFVTLGAFVIALAEPDLNAGYAVSAAISAIATAGPVPAAEGVTVDAAQLNGAARGSLMMLMFLGRLSIYPVILAVGGLVVRVLQMRRS